MAFNDGEGVGYSLPITIITPTYNRMGCLPKLYYSLSKQTNQNFQWLIIDDGSTDDTELAVLCFQNHKFDLVYKKKTNGGKHTALNYSHPFIKGELSCIVDSDDWLLPNAVEEILDGWEKYKGNGNVKLLTYQKGGGTWKSSC